MKDRRTAADAIQNAADMLACASVLVQIGEDADAERWLSSIYEALGLAIAAQDWAVLDTVLLPQFATTPDGEGRRAALATLERLKSTREDLRPAPTPKPKKVLS